MREKPRFSTVADWHAYVNDKAAEGGSVDGAELYKFRCDCYKDIQELRGRPLLVYFTKFPDAPQNAPISIDQTDVDGFTDLIDTATDGQEIDVLIHSPGGSPEATERIVGLLRARFDRVHFLIPHSAFSAATMLALSGDTVSLHPSAVMGPIDPQINGIPARSIRRGFDRVRDLLQEEGPEALPAYIPLLEKHSLELLEICDDSLKLSQELAKAWLTDYMFGEDEERQDTIENAVEFFSSYDVHKTHSRPLGFAKLKDLGLKISIADSALASLLREAYILLNGFFSVGAFVKIFENSTGLSWGRQFQMLQPPPGFPAPPKR